MSQATPQTASVITPKTKYDTVVSSGQSTLKALLTMNGGASVAFLAFIASAVERGGVSPDAGRMFVTAMQWFIMGTFMSVCAYGAIFLTNCFNSIEYTKTKYWMFAFTLVCGSLSLAFFLWASWTAIDGFTVASDQIFRVNP